MLSGGSVTAPTLRGTREIVILGGRMLPLISRNTLERCAFLLLLFTNKVLAGGCGCLGIALLPPVRSSFFPAPVKFGHQNDLPGPNRVTGTLGGGRERSGLGL